MLAKSLTQIDEYHQKQKEQDNAVPSPSGSCRTLPSFEIMIKKALYTQTCGATRREICHCIQDKFGLPPECNRLIKETIEQMLDAGLVYIHHYSPIRYKLTPKGRLIKIKPHYKRKRRKSSVSSQKDMCRYPAQRSKKKASRSTSVVNKARRYRKSREANICRYRPPTQRSHSPFCKYGQKRQASRSRSSKRIVNRYAPPKRSRKQSICRYPGRQHRRPRSVSRTKEMVCRYKPPRKRSRSVSRRKSRSINKMICRYRPQKRSRSSFRGRYKPSKSAQVCRYKPPRHKSRSLPRRERSTFARGRSSSTRRRGSTRRSASNICRYKPMKRARLSRRRSRSNFSKYKPQKQLRRSQQRSRSLNVCRYKPQRQVKKRNFCRYKPQRQVRRRNFCRYKPIRQTKRPRQRNILNFCRYKPQRKPKASFCKYKPPKQRRQKSVCRYLAPAKSQVRKRSKSICRYVPPKPRKPRSTSQNSKRKGLINICRYRPGVGNKKSGMKPKKMSLCKYLAKNKRNVKCKYRSKSKDSQSPRYTSPKRARSPSDRPLPPNNKPTSICKYPEEEESIPPQTVTCKKCGKKKQQK